MLFSYKAITNTGEEKEGTIDAVNSDLAIAALQRRELVIVSVKEAGGNIGKGLSMDVFKNISFFLHEWRNKIELINIMQNRN